MSQSACFVFCKVSEGNFEFSEVPECSFVGKLVGHDVPRIYYIENIIVTVRY